jgi:diguanylate cyclase (GGDEF)-like protein
MEALHLGHLAAALVGAACIALPMWALRRRSDKTLRELDDAIRQFNRGNFATEVQSRARGALGELVRAYNETAHTLSEAREKLASYQRALEERVRDRTRELNAATARAIHVAQTDPLTLLPNRILLTQRLEEAIRRAAADTSRVSVLFIDLDLFKTFNDTLGHETGDSVLRTVAQRLKAAVRPEDVVSRFGGDEFVVLLGRLDFQRAESTTQSIAEDILGALNQPLDIAGSRITMPASIGISCYPQDGRTAADLIKNADSAMYAAKQGGRGRIARYADEAGQPLINRSKLDADIRRGIAAEEFFLVFQPQIELSTGMPAGLEALMRWRHPTRGVVGPVEFISAAEQSGLIHQLGQRALEMACEQFKFWQQVDVYPRISVNVSAKQMENPMWLDSVRDVIEATGIPPQFLDLEITESMLVNNPEQIVATLTELNRLGVTLTLDDFGTGYSSLSYLTRLPFQTIKIDRSFIHEIEIPARRSIVQAILAVAHSLGMRVIAEGIESPLQLTILRELGCEEAQGFYIAKPSEVSAIAPWWTTQVAGVGHTMLSKP